MEILEDDYDGIANFLNLFYLEVYMDSQSINEKNLFRLSALLYRNENYDVKKTTILRKIIESVFIDENKKMYILEVIEFCEIHYCLTLGKKEIESIVKRNTDVFNIKYIDDGDIYFNLLEKKYITLSKFKSLGIEQHINNFIENNNLSKKANEITDIIYRFSYNIFTSNLNGYDYFINNRLDNRKSLVDTTKYSDEETNIINKFIEYEDNDKDKAIFNIVSLSLEYCMITGSRKDLYQNEISNKEFYLDTNIIYRTIGINGDNRKIMTNKFLKKCLEMNISLKISVYTEKEFYKSLKYYINDIKNYRNAYKNTKLYKEINRNQDINNRYCEWICGKRNKDVKYFEAYVKALYDDFKKEYNIEVNYSEIIDMNNKSIERQVNGMSNSICGFKQSDKLNLNDTDAKNILLISLKRKASHNGNNKLMDIKEFMISTDQKLREWNYRNTEYGQPIVFLPSQWLSIMLRFGARTTDDFKSFVSFLNIRNNESIISSEKINIVLDSIVEITENIQMQESLAKILIEDEIDNIVKVYDGNELRDKVKVYTESVYVDLLNRANEDLKIANEENNTVSEQNIELRKSLEETASTLLLAENRLKNEYVNTEIKKWRKRGTIGYGVIICFILLFNILHFVYVDSKYNFVTVLYKWAGNYEQKKSGLNLIEGFLDLGVAIYLINKIYERFNTKSKKYKEKIEEIVEQYEKR